MAIKTNTIVQTTVVDDLDGTTGTDVKTRSFSLGDICYEVELSDANWEAIVERLADVRKPARKVGGKRAVRGSGRRTKSADAGATREENKRIKEWGGANGFEVKARGAASAELRRAYFAAQLEVPASGVGVPEFVAPPEMVAA